MSFCKRSDSSCNRFYCFSINYQYKLLNNPNCFCIVAERRKYIIILWTFLQIVNNIIISLTGSWLMECFSGIN